MAQEQVGKMSVEKIIEEAVSYLLIVVGALLASLSVVCSLIPNDAIDYGTAGIAIIISMLTKWNLSLCVAFVFIPFLVFMLSVRSIWICGGKEYEKNYSYDALLFDGIVISKLR